MPAVTQEQVDTIVAWARRTGVGNATQVIVAIAAERDDLRDRLAAAERENERLAELMARQHAAHCRSQADNSTLRRALDGARELLEAAFAVMARAGEPSTPDGYLDWRNEFRAWLVDHPKDPPSAPGECVCAFPRTRCPMSCAENCRRCRAIQAPPSAPTPVLNCVHGRPGGVMCPHCGAPGETKGGDVMASCEQCWLDSYSYGESDGHVDRYFRLLAARAEKPCSPEAQAGEYAKECPRCKRKTLHQHCGKCMNPVCVDTNLAMPGHQQWPTEANGKPATTETGVEKP